MTPDDFAKMTPEFYKTLARLKARHATMRLERLTIPRTWPPEEALIRRWHRDEYECAIARGYVSLCGYVRVPEGHPCDGVWCDLVQVGDDIDVHGGLMFCQKADGGGVWFGFDTAHCDDWMAMPPEAARAGIYDIPGRIWTEEDVAKEVEKLVKQFKAIANRPRGRKQDERRD